MLIYYQDNAVLLFAGRGVNLVLEVIHGSAWCDNCEKDFNAVVLIVNGDAVISVCSSCAGDLIKKIEKISQELKEKSL